VFDHGHAECAEFEELILARGADMKRLDRGRCAAIRAMLRAPAESRLASFALTGSLAILFLLAGCSSIDYREGPIPGLEHMTVEEHFIDPGEIYRQCSRCGKLGLELPVACTCINFRTHHSVIWLGSNASQSTIEHERAHARGFDHPNGELRSQYAAWTRRVNSQVAATAKPPQGAAPAYAKVSVLGSSAKVE
jgi:hypothetical protein